MNNNCEFAGTEYCMCDSCIGMRKMLEEMRDMNTEQIFREAEEELKKLQSELENT